MLDRRPERLQGLAGQRATAAVDDRDRYPQRKLGGHVLRRDDRSLRVQRVEDRLDEEQVDAALDEALDLLGIGVADLVEGDSAERGIVDARRERERLVERSDRAGDEPPSHLVGGLASEPRALAVQLTDDALEAVVGLADRGRGERVRCRDVGAGLEVGAVDAEDDVRLGQVEDVRVAGDVLRVVAEQVAGEVFGREALALQHRPPGAVEDEDALVEQLPQPLRRRSRLCYRHRVLPVPA